MAIQCKLDMQLAMHKMRSKDFADKIGMTPQTISRIKTGKLKAIKIAELDKMCEILGCGVGDLLEYSPDRPESDGR